MIFNLPLARNLGLVLNAQHPYSLHVAGFDIILNVAYESVDIVEAGPGAVSSMSFEIDDPTSSIDIPDGAEIRMWDYVRDLPMFLGFLEHPEIRLWPAVGRTITVSAYGIESLLDSCIAGPLAYLNTGPFIHGNDQISSAFRISDLIQVLAGFTGLRAGAEGPPINPYVASSLLNPVSGTGPSSGTGYADLIAAGVAVPDLTGLSVRAGLDAFTAATEAQITGPVYPPVYPGVFLSVDFWGGIRYFNFGSGDTTWLPSDYATLTIDDSAGGAVAASDITWSEDHSPGAIVNAVYVKGAAAASTGWVVGDTRTGRHEALATTTGTTPEAMLAAAFPLIGSMGSPVGRGTLRLEDYTPTNVHPGSQMVITEPRLGWSSKVMLVTSIAKRIVPGSVAQDWTVSFMDAGLTPARGPESAMRWVRKVTRGTLH